MMIEIDSDCLSEYGANSIQRVAISMMETARIDRSIPLQSVIESQIMTNYWIEDYEEL